jgi:hypothetical protein
LDPWPGLFGSAAPCEDVHMDARFTAIARLLLASIVAAPSGCAKDEDGSTDTGADASASEGGESAGTEGASTTTAADTGSSTSASTTTPADTSAGDASATTAVESSGDTAGPVDTGSGSESGPSESTGMQGSPCDPDPADDACNMCVKTNCCDEITACVNDPECQCFQECAGSMRGGFEVIMICGDQCGVEDPNNHPTIGPMLSCTTGSCLVQCL